MSPPLIVNFKPLTGEHEILFLPFVPKKHLKHYRLSKHHRQPNYSMFDYHDLAALPHFRLTKHGRRNVWIPGQLAAGAIVGA
jgi:hypothetical protein